MIILCGRLWTPSACALTRRASSIRGVEYFNNMDQHANVTILGGPWLLRVLLALLVAHPLIFSINKGHANLADLHSPTDKAVTQEAHARFWWWGSVNDSSRHFSESPSAAREPNHSLGASCFLNDTMLHNRPGHRPIRSFILTLVVLAAKGTISFNRQESKTERCDASLCSTHPDSRVLHMLPL